MVHSKPRTAGDLQALCCRVRYTVGEQRHRRARSSLRRSDVRRPICGCSLPRTGISKIFAQQFISPRIVPRVLPRWSVEYGSSDSAILGSNHRHVRARHGYLSNSKQQSVLLELLDASHGGIGPAIHRLCSLEIIRLPSLLESLATGATTSCID